MTKRCPKCETVKEAGEFAAAKRRADGLSSWCKTCNQEYRREYNQRREVKHRGAQRSLKRYHSLSPVEKWRMNKTPARDSARLMKLYKITLEKYDQMLANQAGVCRLCGTPPKRNKLSVDHDHNCCPGRVTCGGCIRGLVCVPCNLALGRIENAEWIAKAAAYIAHDRAHPLSNPQLERRVVNSAIASMVAAAGPMRRGIGPLEDAS